MAKFNSRFNSRFRTGALLCMLAMAGVAEAGDLTGAQVAERTKPAVALVDLNNNRQSAACLAPSGLFVTEDRILSGLALDGEVSLVLNSGLKTQKTLKAKLVRRDKDLGLVLLQAQSDDKLPALDLAADDKLMELTDVVAFGFPSDGNPQMPGRLPFPGRRTPQQGEKFQNLSVRPAKIKSLKTDDNGDLHRIELDAPLESGYWGGPVVNMEGKILGVSAGNEQMPGQPGASVIPVGVIRRLLERPVIALDAPIIKPEDKQKEARFAVTVTTLALADPDLDVQLLLKSAGSAERAIPMKPVDGKYVAQAVPFPGAVDEYPVHLELKYPDGAITAAFKDQQVDLGIDTVKLDEIVHIKSDEKNTVVKTTDGRELSCTVKPIALTGRLAGQAVEVKLEKATEVTQVETGEESALSCIVVVRSKDHEVGRSAYDLYVEGTRRASLDKIRDGQFIKPLRASAPTTYFKAVSTGGYIAGAHTFDATENDLTFQGNPADMTVGVEGYMVTFGAPQGHLLQPGEYNDAKRHAFRGDSPGLEFMGNGRGSNEVGGKFVVWEYEVKDNKVVKAAIDFIFLSENHGPPIYGMVRYHSSLQ